MSDQILDNEQDEFLKASLEDYIWKSKPKTSFWEALTKLGSYHGMLLGLFIGVILLFLSAAVSIIVVLLLLSLFIIPILVVRKHNSHTNYYLLKKGICLTETNWKWKKQFLFIPFDNISRVDFLRKSKKAGDLIIITKDKQITPTTRPSEYPRMLDLEEAKEVAELIYKTMSK